MAIRLDDIDNTSLLAALGGTVNANDTIRLRKYAKSYTLGSLTGNPDLAAAYLDAGFAGEFSAQAGGGSSAVLTLVVNQGGTGVFVDQSNARRVELQSTSSSGVIYEVRYLAGNGHVLALGAMDLNNLRVLRPGTVIVGGDCDCNVANASAGSTEFRESAYALGTLTAGGNEAGDAAVILNRDVGTLNVEGRAVVSINSTTVSPTTVNLRGGMLVLGLCGDITTLQGDSGVIDQRGLTSAITIATSALGPGVTILRSGRTVVPAVTTNNDYGGWPRILVTP